MLETGTSGLMSGEGKRAAASRPRTAPFLDSTSGPFSTLHLRRSKLIILWAPRQFHRDLDQFRFTLLHAAGLTLRRPARHQRREREISLRLSAGVLVG